LKAARLTAQVEPWRRRTSQEKQIIAVLLLITVAIVGYLYGHGNSTVAPVERTREASNAVTVITYDSASGWLPVSSAPTIPGLAIGQSLVLGPGDGAKSAGLVVGQLLESEFGPLPPRLLAALRQPPQTDVVDLLNTQAYRYSGLSLTGSGLRLTLYTIPSSASTTMAVVCYADSGDSRYLPECEHLAGTLTISTGSPQAEVRTYQALTPQLAFGRQLSAIVARVDALLATERPQLGQRTSSAKAAIVARRLADELAGAAGSIAAVRPPPAAARAQGSLSESLRRAGEAYSALAAAAGGENTFEFRAALTQVYSAEAVLSGALKDFGLLAYK
jgi:hypothetical protein